MYKRKQLNHQGRVRRPFYPPGQDKEHPFVRGAEIKLAAVSKRHREPPHKQGDIYIYIPSKVSCPQGG